MSEEVKINVEYYRKPELVHLNSNISEEPKCTYLILSKALCCGLLNNLPCIYTPQNVSHFLICKCQQNGTQHSLCSHIVINIKVEQPKGFEPKWPMHGNQTIVKRIKSMSGLQSVLL